MRKCSLFYHVFTVFTKTLLLLCLLLLQKNTLLAQDQSGIILKGNVTDVTGLVLPGVTVQLKGSSSIGTITGIDGDFSLALPADVTSGSLVFSYISFTSKEISFKGSQNIQVSLSQQTNNLNQVVVIGYGTAQAKNLTGAVATVNADDFNPGPTATPGELLEGKVAGVVVTPNSGQPGAGTQITIRGINSISTGTQPLIVLDGVPLSGATINGASDPLSTIDPDDIESITVLKDAAACAIYGNRGSEGVILITTKSGKSGGKLQVSINTTTSVSTLPKELNLLDANQVRSLVDEYGTPAQIAQLGTANTNWQKQIYQNAAGINDDVTLTGGIKNLPYRLTLGYYGQDGILETGYLKREALGLSLTPTFFNKSLKVTVNFNGTHSDNRFANTSAIGDATHFDPTQYVYSGNSNYGGYYTWTEAGLPNSLAPNNPVADLNDKRDFSDVFRGIGNVQLEYALPSLPELKVVVNAGGDIATSNGSTWTSPQLASNFVNGGTFDNYSQYQRNALFDFYLNYRKYFKRIKSTLDVTAGTEYQDFRVDAPAQITYYTILQTPTVSAPDSTETTYFSEYARLTYTFNDKYILSGSIRKDQSSLVVDDNHSGVFPSISGAWRINEENFLKNVNWLSDLKLRAGYGSTGNSNISPYQYIPFYSPTNSNGLYPLNGNYYNPLSPAKYNTDIKWETTTGTNVAVDYGFLKNRISGSIEYYDRNTTNLLINAPVPEGANLSNVLYQNVGSLSNKGAEFTINAVPIATKNINWSVGFNIGYNKNEITSLYNGTSILSGIGGISGGTGNTIQANVVGQPVNSFYPYQQVYAANGAPIEGLFVGQKNGALNYTYKSPTPTTTLGFNTQFAYRNWSLFASMHADIGNYVYNNVESNFGTINSVVTTAGYIGNGTTEIYNSKFYSSQYLSDYYIQNASFLRMDNITVSYNFGKIINRKVGLKISAICQNVFLITKYNGLNPEVFSGIDNNLYPLPRIYSLGVNLTF